MSEAQKYQEIRRHWKKKYRFHQRKQALAWADGNSLGLHGGTPRRPWKAKVAAGVKLYKDSAKYHQTCASEYARMLNQFKFNKKDKKNTVS